jgi:hypothetical protein
MEPPSQFGSRSHDPSPLGTDSFDDMHDSDAELARYPRLPLAFEWCRKITEKFKEYDDLALSFQHTHHRITYAAAFLATLAVATAILGLSYHSAGPGMTAEPPAAWWLSKLWLDRIELFLAGCAVGTVGWGWHREYRDSWLLYRHRAESCRLLRYSFLIHPSAWREGEQAARGWIEPRLEEIRQTRLKAAVVQPSPHGPFEGTQSRLPRATLRALTEYYLSRRLNPQKEYLANRTQTNEFSDRVRRYIFVFFFGSILAVFFKSAVKVIVRKGAEDWELSLGLLAALLPAAAAGVRTWRSAFEFSRNKSRFEAAHAALRDLESRLVTEGFSAVEGQNAATSGRRITLREEQVLTATEFSQVSVRTEEPAGEAAGNNGDQETEAYEILRDLSWSEHILESEHREWLRLMYETEWFG